MRKAQSSSFVFVMLIILFFSLIVGISLAFISHKVNTSKNEIVTYNFLNELKDNVGHMSYGQKKDVTLTIPTSVLKVCFYDPNPIPKINHHIERDEFTPYLQALFNGTKDNVAIEKNDKTYETEELKNLRLRGSIVKCYYQKGILKLSVESLGGGEFTVEKIEHV